MARPLAPNPNLPPIRGDVQAVVNWLMDAVGTVMREHDEGEAPDDTWQALWEMYDGGPYAGFPYDETMISGLIIRLMRQPAELTSANARIRYSPHGIDFYMPYSVSRVDTLVGIPGTWRGKTYVTLDMIRNFPRVWREYFRRLVIHEMTHTSDRAAMAKSSRYDYSDKPGEIRAFSAQFCDMMRPPKIIPAPVGWMQTEVDRVLSMPQHRIFWADMSDSSKALCLKYMVSYAVSKKWIDR